MQGEIEMTQEQVKELQEVRSRALSNTHRLDRLECTVEGLREESKAIYELGSSVRIIADSLTGMKDDLKEVKSSQVGLTEKIGCIKQDVADARNQPIKSKSEWFDKILWVIVGGAVAYLLNQFIQSMLK